MMKGGGRERGGLVGPERDGGREIHAAAAAAGFGSEASLERRERESQLRA